MAIISISGKINSGKDTVGKIIQIISGSPHFTNQAVIDFLDKPVLQNEWEIKRFADKLKDMVCLLIGCTREQLEDREFKEKELGEEWVCYGLYSNFKNNFAKGNLFLTKEEAYIKLDQYKNTIFPTATFKDDVEVKERRMTPRLLMQLIGTECGRQIIHPNIWVNALMSDYKPLVSTQGVIMNLGMSTSQLEKVGKEVPIEYPNWVITDTRFPNELKAVKDRKGITIRVDRDYVLTGGPEDPKDQHESETALDNAEFDYVIDNNGSLEELIEKVREILTKEKLN